MALRIALVPVVGSGVSSEEARRPKYVADGGLTPMPRWAAIDYGFEPWMVVAADLSASHVTALQAEADVFLLPADLDALLTVGQVAAVQTALEAIPLPAEWVTTAFTWRGLLRIVLGICRFMARYTVVFAEATQLTTRVFTGGVDLTRTIGSLPLAVRTALTATATSLGLDTTGVTGATTLRGLLRTVGLQGAATPTALGAVVI